jgi:hypothetical protein
MEDFLTRVWDHLVDRIGGPMSLRFLMQPTMAIFFGIIDGLRFAREGRSLLLWGGPEDPSERRAQRRATWWCIGKVFALAIILDVIYQIVVFKWFYFLETLIVAIAVALVPYFLVRGLVNYLTRAWRGPKPPEPKP